MQDILRGKFQIHSFVVSIVLVQKQHQGHVKQKPFNQTLLRYQAVPKDRCRSRIVGETHIEQQRVMRELVSAHGKDLESVG